MAEIVGRDNPFTPQMRKVLKGMDPFTRNQFLDNAIKAAGAGYKEKSNAIRNLLTDDTYTGEDMLYQYIGQSSAEVPITRYTRKEETGISEPYTEHVKVEIPGLDSETYQAMGEIWDASKNEYAQKIFGSDTKTFNDVEAQIQDEWNNYSSAFNNTKINLSARDGFFKAGYYFYGRANAAGKSFSASEVSKELFTNSYYVGESPGNPLIKIMIPKVALSPFGSYDNEQVFFGLNMLRENVDKYISSKILDKIATDKGGNIKIYLKPSITNDGLAIYSTNKNIDGSDTRQGVIPWETVASYVTFENKMAMLHDFDYIFASNDYQDFVEEIKEFEEQAFDDGQNISLTRSLFEISPTFAKGLDQTLAKKMFDKTSLLDPAFEMNASFNFLRGFFYNQTEIGLIERDVIVEVLKQITPESSSDEIREVLNTVRSKEVAKIVSALDDIDLLSDGLIKFWKKELEPRAKMLGFDEDFKEAQSETNQNLAPFVGSE